MNELAIAVAIILFPGLIASVIADKITAHTRHWGTFKYGIYSFVFGVSCYGLLQIFYYFAALFFGFNPRLHVWSLISPYQIDVSLVEVFFATLLSPVVAFTAVYIFTHKLFHHIAIRFNISNKYGDENLYSFFLQNRTWLYIRDIENNLTYEGLLVSYSENDHIQEIVLSEVTVYSYKDSEKYYSVPSMYLSKAIGKFNIEEIPKSKWETENAQEARK